MRKLLLLLGQPHSGSDITCVHRDCARMTCGVSIPGVKSRDESRCEGEVSSLKGDIYVNELPGQLSLVLIQHKETLSREPWNEKEWKSKRRNLVVRKRQKRDDRRVQWDSGESQGNEFAKCFGEFIPPAYSTSNRSEPSVQCLGNNSTTNRCYRHSDKLTGN